MTYLSLKLGIDMDCSRLLSLTSATGLGQPRPQGFSHIRRVGEKTWERGC